MISQDALYDVIEAAIAAAGSSDAIFEAKSFRQLRELESSDAPSKIIRAECTAGFLCRTDADVRKELNVRATIEFIKLPDSTSEEDLDDAKLVSFEMAREIFDILADNPSLSGRVCDNYFDEFEKSIAKFSGVLHGITYLDGMINRSS